MIKIKGDKSITVYNHKGLKRHLFINEVLYV